MLSETTLANRLFQVACPLRGCETFLLHNLPHRQAKIPERKEEDAKKKVPECGGKGKLGAGRRNESRDGVQGQLRASERGKTVIDFYLHLIS
jgi:hypothetical protein